MDYWTQCVIIFSHSIHRDAYMSLPRSPLRATCGERPGGLGGWGPNTIPLCGTNQEIPLQIITAPENGEYVFPTHSQHNNINLTHNSDGADVVVLRISILMSMHHGNVYVCIVYTNITNIMKNVFYFPQTQFPQLGSLSINPSIKGARR